MVKVKLDVTKKEISNGTPNDGSHCPIALAALKAGFTEVQVDEEFGFYITEGADEYSQVYYSVPLPKAASKFIDDFDSHGEVKPFSLTLRIPNKVAKLLKLKKKALAATA